MDLMFSILYILRIYILNIIVNAQNDQYDTCNDEALNYWRAKYNKSYSGTALPRVRCDQDGGYCLYDEEVCPSGDHIRYQTECYNRCDCCFREVRKYENSYHWTMVQRRLKWRTAEDYCRDVLNADLLVPENIAYLIAYLRKENMGATDVWVGINDAHQGEFEGIHGNMIDDGWQRGQPKLEADSGENCIVVEDDEFDGAGMKVEPCFALNFFICDTDDEHRRVQHPVTYDEEILKKGKDEDEGFGSDREKYYGRGIKIIGLRRNWKSARADCQKRGGDLLVPESVSTFIKYMSKQGVGARDVWIGYNDEYYERHFEGIHGNMIDGGWQNGEPRSVDPGKDCVVVEDDQRDGEGMKVEPCYEKHIYVCDLTINFDSEHSTRE